jgi:hypothetical protein
MRKPLRPRVSLFFRLLAVGFILPSNNGIWAQEKANKTPLEVIGSQAVFKPPSRDVVIGVTGSIQACGTVSAKVGEPQFIACVVSVMQQAGASPAATAFTTMLKGEGYLDHFRKMGRVDLASVAYPFRANENGEYLLVNGVPRLVHLDDPENLKHIDITKDPLYPSLLRKFPKLELWGHADFKDMQRLPGGGQRFVFTLVLLNGCHGCEVGGYAHVAFDFDETGQFLGTRLLRLSKAP